MFNQSVSNGVKTLMDVGYYAPANFINDGIPRYNSIVPGATPFPDISEFVTEDELKEALLDYVTKQELEDALNSLRNEFVTWKYATDYLVHYEWFYDYMKSYPTWEEANATYVAYDVLKSYPTWTETNATYVDWGTFNSVIIELIVAAQAEVMNALLGLGVEAECDASGNVTVTLTGIPTTSVDPGWPTGPWGGGGSPGVSA